MVDVTSLRFLLAKRFFSSSPCFLLELKNVADLLRLVSSEYII